MDLQFLEVLNMRVITHSLICALLIALTVACGPKPYENRGGFTSEDFREEAAKLALSMSREVVDSLIGEPDETSIRVLSSDDDKKTWRELEWRYRWFDRDLALTFRKFLDNEWQLHRWEWHILDSRI